MTSHAATDDKRRSTLMVQPDLLAAWRGGRCRGHHIGAGGEQGLGLNHHRRAARPGMLQPAASAACHAWLREAIHDDAALAVCCQQAIPCLRPGEGSNVRAVLHRTRHRAAALRQVCSNMHMPDKRCQAVGEAIACGALATIRGDPNASQSQPLSACVQRLEPCKQSCALMQVCSGADRLQVWCGPAEPEGSQ